MVINLSPNGYKSITIGNKRITSGDKFLTMSVESHIYAYILVIIVTKLPHFLE